jgi:large subunit ribosomal protein L1
MSKESKRHKEAKALVEQGRLYTSPEAVRLLKSMETANFDETVEVHIKLGINPRHADQQVRGTMMLPHGTGKTLRVAVFAKGDKAAEAEEAGADVVGAEDLATRVQEGFLDFDAAVATPDMMGVVGKLGRILGPRGLMPNPKAGTVTFEVGKAVKDMKAGKIEYRTDKFGAVHLIIGKKSFEEPMLVENYRELLDEIVRAKPSAAKGKYLRSVTITSTMGPGIPIDTSKSRAQIEEETAAG